MLWEDKMEKTSRKRWPVRKSQNRQGVFRFWELDSLRGLAVILMVIFHFIFDLTFFRVYSFNLSSAFWIGFARITAAIFIFLVGASLTISFSRKPQSPLRKYLKRGLWIFFLGLVITLATYLTFPEGTIYFGVLHFIGIAVILGYLSLRLKTKTITLLAIVILSIGLYLQTLSFTFPWLMWLGLMPQNFYTFDYFPIFPWLGVTLLGIVFGKTVYPKGKRKFKIKDRRTPLNWLGRHSLIIYFLHQPILVGLLLLL